MDANQTRYHLLLGESDWRRCAFFDRAGSPVSSIASSAADWDAKRHELTLRPLLFEFAAAPGDRAPVIGDPHASPPDLRCDRRGAARDRFGNWYFIGLDKTVIQVQSPGRRTAGQFWPAPDGLPCAPEPSAGFRPADPPAALEPRRLSGLAVTEDHYLVAGTIEPNGLLVFDLHAGGPPIRHLLWPGEIPFEPFELAPRRGGGAAVLDRTNRRYWLLDRALRIEQANSALATIAAPRNETFQPEDGALARTAAARTFPPGLSLEAGSPLLGLDPIGIEMLNGGAVLILDRNPGGWASRVALFDHGQMRGQPVTLENTDPRLETPPGHAFRLRAYDFAFRASVNLQKPEFLGRLDIVAAEGNQTFAFDARIEGGQLFLKLLAEFIPMRLFGGMGAAADGEKIYYDSNGRWLPLVAQPRPRYETEAVFVTDPAVPFDGREPRCAWHRLFLDASFPAETNIEVWSRAADGPEQLELCAWKQEPSPYRRRDGSELPFLPSSISADRGTFELLFQEARGRYLQLRVRLAGNGRITPRLRAMRIYYPRFSYLDRYLPAVYREDPASASFLGRFLANFEGVNTAIEDKIAAAQTWFDARCAPVESLDWLAGWLGVALDPAWDARRRRLFLAHALDFFAWRGTAHGLRMALRLALEPNPDEHIFDPPGSPCRCGERFRIVERFIAREDPGAEAWSPDSGPRARRAGERWSPDAGADELQRRYRQVRGNALAVFSLEPAADPDEEAARRAFAFSTLGFVPASPADEIAAWRRFVRARYASALEWRNVNGGAASSLAEAMPPQDRPDAARLREEWRLYQLETSAEPFGERRARWQQFLSRRYESVLALQAQHGTHWDRFDAVPYPAALPARREVLRDWHEFESSVLPALGTAHRFSVLLPLSPAEAPDQDERRALLSRARRVIDLERPAHTAFDVNFYWALFRVGEARLGTDSALGLGGRDPDLLPKAAAGRAHLGESAVTTQRTFGSDERASIGEIQLKTTRGSP